MADANNMNGREKAVLGEAGEKKQAGLAAENMTNDVASDDGRYRGAKEKAESSKDSSFALRIITPEKTLFDGRCESVTVETADGFEGFLRGRAACCKLLAAHGRIKLRAALGNCEKAAEPNGGTAPSVRSLKTDGGFLHMDGRLLIYADAAEWDEE